MDMSEHAQPPSTRAPKTPLRKLLNRLYFGTSQLSLRFQTAMLILDAAIILFFVVSPFLRRDGLFLVFDYSIATFLALDLVLRAWAFGDFRRWLMRPIVWADILVLVSLLGHAFLPNLGFLRILRAYSLVHGETLWRIVGKGRWRDSTVAELAKAVVNLLVFIFMMTALVHSSFAGRVPELNSYMESLYFTVTTLTTTGFGDITLPGFWGRALSILIMIGGVSLFFRLVQVTMRVPKVRHPCHSCGLMRHEADAVHCKACGAQINISHDND
jgi:voltage-gated potassium channel